MDTTTAADVTPVELPTGGRADYIWGRLTTIMHTALRNTQPNHLVPGHARTLRGLRLRGLVDRGGYLTDDGQAIIAWLRATSQL